LRTSQSKHFSTSLSLLRLLALRTNVTFFITIETHHITTLAFCNGMPVLTTTETPFLILRTSITLVALPITLVTNNLGRSIFPSRPPLIYPLLTLISRSIIRLKTTLLTLTSSLTHNLVMSFGILVINSTATH